MPLHVYGVTRDSVEPPSRRAGRADRPLRPVEGDGLRVVVSEIEADARVRRDDLLTHAHVLEAMAALGTVIPVQFGVVMPDDAAVLHELVETRGDHIRTLLERFEGLVQLTVSVGLEEEQALRETLRRDPDLAALRELTRSPGARGPHSAELQLGEAVAAALDALRLELADGVIERLAPTARAVSVGDVRGALQVAEVALLVERDRRRQLDEVVTALRDDLAPVASLRYVGPQPPYAFLDSASSEAPAWV